MTKIWGPKYWLIIHCVSIQLKYKDARKILDHIHLILPCGMCRNNAKRERPSIPKETYVNKNKDILFEWSVKFHNIVNKSLGKKVLSYKEIKNLRTYYLNRDIREEIKEFRNYLKKIRGNRKYHNIKKNISTSKINEMITIIDYIYSDDDTYDD